ncbi:unnamed protein product [Bursaphelenchus xylophilus]|uniref:Galactosylgalactosylxylosylprotein 3-beta-glucuronosyltransferase n=1 Tax=Bursaphelenchus xylophilus TaxID=6326 RepID=A0A811KPT3_BURXY|nr:unnamed protein product [Bursaphelenchus xylophilus]CAG9101480.1 unnamed protein product [Bursaphelenchus xylophilus]
MRYIRTERADSVVDSTPADNKTIIVITPTKQRPERLADLTMLAQTLKQVGNLYWVVVEDADKTADLVSDLLARTGINHTYLATTNHGLPCRGWAQRNLALDYLRQNKDKFNEKDVIYFADDDNGYDLRLFDQYIRKVDVMGVWAVGIPGNALVEAPKVENGKVVGWHSAYLPDREFATDMAGFALNFGLVVSTNASWSLKCAGNFPEQCFLKQLNLSRSDLEPFGWESDKKPILVWHRQTAPAPDQPFDLMGYMAEYRLPQDEICKKFQQIHLMTYEQAEAIAKEYGPVESESKNEVKS